MLAFLCLLFSATSARAEEEELRFLELYNGPIVEVVSADRSPRPASQTAENITVVTAKDIEDLNAHTLADVLFPVTGVQLEYLRTPGSVANLEIQGAIFNHILVLIDNVPINNLGDNFPDIATIPVQMIERVEIVKGAASSSWGNALGGVVNVITKAPQTDRPFGGMVSVSEGKKWTVDGRGEVSGTVNRFGYYLTGGKLRSDGLIANNWVDLNNFYSKFNYDLPLHGSIVATTSVVDSSSGQLQQVPVNVNQYPSQILATLSVHYPLSDRLAMEGGFRARRATARVDIRRISNGTLLRDATNEDELTGALFKLSWLDDLQRLVVGVDYDHVGVHLMRPLARADLLKANADRVGVYLNDTFTFLGFAVTPSARFDHTETGGDLFSPSFGITYALTDNTVLRGYTARGYSLTSLNRQNSTEKVWTSQVGFESADVPFLWLKGTLFRNDTWNIDMESINPAKRSLLKQGFEVEAKTVPWFNTSLSVGYTYIDATDGDTGAVVKGVPRHTVDLGIRYENSRNLRALLTAHYIDWNLGAVSPGSTYHDIIWDLYLGKKVHYSDVGSVEIFGSLRNLFSGDQYQNLATTQYRNPHRWGEVGIRWEF